MTEIRKEPLENVMRAAWQNDTTSSPDEWDGNTSPERGQCVPTALVVQDFLGGDIERLATVYNGTKETHYRNIIDGEVFDLTRAQYPDDQEFTPAPLPSNEGDPTIREYVLSYQATEERYHILAQRVTQLLNIETSIPLSPDHQ